MPAEPIHRAPMRARDRGDVAAVAGADHGVAAGLVGIGDVLPDLPASLEAALSAQDAAHGRKAARMLRHFADLPEGTLVWTRGGRGFHLGRISGAYRYDASDAARRVGVPHVRPARWLPRAFAADEVPPGVVRAFARGGRNLQRIRDPAAEARSAELWATAG